MIPWIAVIIATYCSIRLIRLAFEKSAETRTQTEQAFSMVCLVGVALIAVSCFKIYEISDGLATELKKQTSDNQRANEALRDQMAELKRMATRLDR